MTITYDRFIPYLRTINSVKHSLDDKVKLEILVDSKLSDFKFQVKKFLTKIVLGKSNYTYGRGMNCIGLSRDYMLENTKSEYVIILDDDDMLNSKAFNRFLFLTNLHFYDLINFDYQLNSNKLRGEEFNDIKPPEWNLWFAKSIKGINVGTSTIFKVDLYRSLDEFHKFNLTKVDDMVPFHVMYHKTNNILAINDLLVLRCRGKNSLMNSSDDIKLDELCEAINLFRYYLYYDKTRSKEKNKIIFKITLSNQIHYHTIKSGTEFTDRLLDKLGLTKSDIYELDKIR